MENDVMNLQNKKIELENKCKLLTMNEQEKINYAFYQIKK